MPETANALVRLQALLEELFDVLDSLDEGEKDQALSMVFETIAPRIGMAPEMIALMLGGMAE